MEQNKLKKHQKILLFIGLLLFLILLDQGIKLLVNATYTFDGDPMQIHDCIHIHPEINGRTVKSLLELSESRSWNFSLLMTLNTLPAENL